MIKFISPELLGRIRARGKIKLQGWPVIKDGVSSPTLTTSRALKLHLYGGAAIKDP